MTFYATEEKASGRFVGIIGLKPVAEELPIAPAVEIGWRLSKDVWGRGLAPEGARMVLRLVSTTLAWAASFLIRQLPTRRRGE